MGDWKTTLDTNKVEYYTPAFIVDYFGYFDYDPATTPEQAKYLGIKHYDTKETNGLFSDWTQYENIWINPPFNQKIEFFKKAVETYKKARNNIYFLCPIEFLTTAKFHNALKDVGIGLYIPDGRIKFLCDQGTPKHTPAFGSVILHIQDRNGLSFLNLTNKKEANKK